MVQINLAARGRITTYFGQNIGRGFPHNGVDQGHGNGAAVDLEIRSPAAGVVTFAGSYGSYGKVIFITHADGWVSVLAHHARQFVKAGDRVTQGQLIAVMGNSGTVYVHNHQELRDDRGRQVDPLLHLSSASTAANTTTPLELEMTPEQNRMLTSVYDAIFNGGPSMKDGTKSVAQTLADISKTVNQAVVRDGKNIAQIQDNADTNTMVRKLLMVPAVSGGAVIDYAALAKAVNDDAAARLAS